GHREMHALSLHDALPIFMGKYGEDRSKKDGGGQSWKLQKAFVEKIRELMEYQSRDAQMHYEFNKRMHPPARFVYPPRDWDFQDRSEEHTSELQSRENLVC